MREAVASLEYSRTPEGVSGIIFSQLKINDPEYKNSGIGGIICRWSIAYKFNYMLPWRDDNGLIPLNRLGCNLKCFGYNITLNAQRPLIWCIDGHLQRYFSRIV